ncbi:dihydrodipicolinate synthase family protein [Ancylobacter sp.]|uniref:dihydrodipicolinate synthase family protein n=1 Tax=Ancylobacter sp. TaxID=1872567 RepID=UPI003D12B7F0
MWQGVYPAVTAKFNEDDTLDHKEMERSFALQIDASVDGIIVNGSLGEGPMLSHDERLAVLKTAKSVAGKRPVLMTIADAATRDCASLAKRAAQAGADGLMVVPSLVYHTNAKETVASMGAVAQAADLPVMIYSNRIAYRVDVTIEIMAELAKDSRFVAVKESSDDIRRTVELQNAFGDRYDIFTGVDNLAFEALALGAVGWVAGLVVAFPEETVAIYRLMKAKRYDEALEIYRWFRPLLDLDVSTYLVQNLKLVEAMVTGTTERVRSPRLVLDGEQRAKVEKIVRDSLATRPTLAKAA